jgi:hypothetical protein
MYTFPTVGKTNTAETISLAFSRARELGINDIVVATTSGRTGVEVAERFKGAHIVAVTHSTGFSAPGVQELDLAHVDKMKAWQVDVLTTTHAFGGVGRAIRRKFKTYQVDEVIAQTLRIFGEGTKVAIEITLMAADAGLIPINKDIIAFGGTSSGTDTALVLRAAHAQDFFDIKVREIICKPAL